MTYPRPIQQLGELFAALPGIGPRQSIRLAFAVLEKEEQFRQRFADVIRQAGSTITHCSTCGRSIEINTPNTTHCIICISKERDASKILVVEKESDVETFEQRAIFNGRYHILGGLVKPLEKNPVEGLRLRELFLRIKKHPTPKSVEVIVATANTAEGNQTANYIGKILEPLQVTTTRLGRGLATGAEIEYADSLTLEAALKNRN